MIRSGSKLACSFHASGCPPFYQLPPRIYTTQKFRARTFRGNMYLRAVMSSLKAIKYLLLCHMNDRAAKRDSGHASVEFFKIWLVR